MQLWASTSAVLQNNKVLLLSGFPQLEIKILFGLLQKSLWIFGAFEKDFEKLIPYSFHI